MIDTSETLLDRLKVENAHDAWREFYHLYWGAVLRYARKLGLSEHQAEEVLQETMVTLIRLLPTFVYDRRKGRFRNFLLTIVHRKSLAKLRNARRNLALPLDLLNSDYSPDIFDHNNAAAAEARARWREALGEEALRRLRDDPALGENTFAVFQAYTIEGRAASAVAAEFGLTENAVYQIKNRLLRRLQRELANLLRSSGAE